MQQYAHGSSHLRPFPGILTQLKISSRYSTQVDIPLWRDGALLGKMERVQVLHEYKKPAPGAKTRRMDTAPGREVGETETGVEQ